MGHDNCLVFGKKAPVDVTLEPFRRHNQRHAVSWQRGKDPLLLLVIPLFHSLAKRLRIRVLYGAGRREPAPVLPLTTTCIMKMNTVPRYCPTIVKGPDHLATMLQQPSKEHFHVNVITQERVHVHNVGINLIKLMQQPSCYAL